MKLAIKGTALVTAAALSFALVSVALAETAEPVLGFAGNVTGTVESAGKSHVLPGISVTSVVYDNTTSAANFGFSSTDVNAQFGDRLSTVGTGVLNAHKFTIFNSGSSLGPMLTATVQLSFFDAVTAAALGSYNVNVNFGAGLNPGFFSIVNVTNLDALAINLSVTDIVVIQRVLNFTGTASRFGFASLNPPTVGSSPDYFYASATTVGGGVPGYYNLSVPANPGYQVIVTVPTVGVESKTWSGVKGLFR